jgi:acetylornithine deacetylase/succinyl-diaminopimelate desuccinylase-like protein
VTPAAWTSPPFAPTIRDGRVFCRGSADNKGQHLAHILAVEVLGERLGLLPCEVTFLLDGEEEIGSPNLRAFVDTHRDELAADLLIWSDGPVYDPAHPSLSFGVRGIVTFELSARGAATELHSGNWGGVAPNPLWRLVQALASMRSPDGRITIDGFYDDVEPPSVDESEAIAALGVDEEELMATLNVDRLDDAPGWSVAERLSAWPSFTINGFHGGYGGTGPRTVLPNEATASCDIRLVAAQTAEDVFAKTEAHLARYAPDVRLVRGHGTDPSKTSLDAPYTRAIKDGMEAAYRKPAQLLPPLGGTLPEAVFTRLLRLPAFGIPLANPDESNHAPDENLELERFVGGVKAAAAVLLSLAAAES